MPYLIIGFAGEHYLPSVQFINGTTSRPHVNTKIIWNA